MKQGKQGKDTRKERDKVETGLLVQMSSTKFT